VLDRYHTRSCGPAPRSTSQAGPASRPSTNGWRPSAPIPGRNVSPDEKTYALILVEADLDGGTAGLCPGRSGGAAGARKAGKYAIDARPRSSCESFCSSQRRDRAKKLSRPGLKRGREMPEPAITGRSLPSWSLRNERAKLLASCDPMCRLPGSTTKWPKTPQAAPQAARRGSTARLAKASVERDALQALTRKEGR